MMLTHEGIFEVRLPFIVVREAFKGEDVFNPLPEPIFDVRLAPWHARDERRGRFNLRATVEPGASARFAPFDPAGGALRFLTLSYGTAACETVNAEFEAPESGIVLRHIPFYGRGGLLLQKRISRITCVSSPTPGAKWCQAFQRVPLAERRRAIAGDARAWTKRQDLPVAAAAVWIGLADPAGVVWAVEWADAGRPIDLALLSRSYATDDMARRLVFGWESPGLGGPFPELEIAEDDLLRFDASRDFWLFADAWTYFDRVPAGLSAFVWSRSSWSQR